MAYRLSSDTIRLAVKHISKYGDTDIFPNIPMLDFLIDDEDSIVDCLAKIDLDVFNPSGTIEVLSPKRQFGFRIVNQQNLIDTILLLACVLEISSDIENKRNKIESHYSYSYRMAHDSATGDIFNSDVNFKSWLIKHQEIINRDISIKFILSLDIADFYSRIYFHRLENLLDETVPEAKRGASSFIKKCIKNIRSRQSFGLPIGSNSARILAELALSDFDEMLSNYGVVSSRYVDDFRIFLKSESDAQATIGFFAEALYKNEGLTLNDSKTKLESRDEYLEKIETDAADPQFVALNDAIGIFESIAYDGREVTDEVLHKIAEYDLLEQLNKEIHNRDLNVSKIKLLLKALRFSPSEEAGDFIKANLIKLLILPRETCLLIGKIVEKIPNYFDDFGSEIIEALNDEFVGSVLVIRFWLLEIFSRGYIIPTYQQTDRITQIVGATNRQQLFLIRGVIGDKNFFRGLKTAFNNIVNFEIPYLLLGATCLPKDEYCTWVNLIKSQIHDPINKLHAEWLVKNFDIARNSAHYLTSDHID